MIYDEVDTIFFFRKIRLTCEGKAIGYKYRTESKT